MKSEKKRVTIGLDGKVRANSALEVRGGRDVIFKVDKGKTAHLYFSPFNQDPIVIHGERTLRIPPDAKKNADKRFFFYRVTIPGITEFPSFMKPILPQPIPGEPGDPCIIVNGNGNGAVKGKGKKKSKGKKK